MEVDFVSSDADLLTQNIDGQWNHFLRDIDIGGYVFENLKLIVFLFGHEEGERILSSTWKIRRIAQTRH